MASCECASASTALSARKYLADGNVDVRLATENVLAEFLREIKYIANVQEKQVETERMRREATLRKRGSKYTIESTDDDALDDQVDGEDGETEVDEHEWEGEGSGAWVPGQGVFVDHAAVMDTIIQHLPYPGR